MKELFLALGLCHNVTPVMDEEGARSLQASSPDEIALVNASEQYGLILKERTQKEIVLEWELVALQEKYQIL